jgi:hypothetical protein
MTGTQQEGDVMTDPDLVKLLFGPYKAPPLKRGDWAFCLYRDCAVTITNWSDAPISWPRCRALHVRRSPPGLLVDDELARAVCHESEVAVAYWWGIHRSTVAKWRKVLEVTRKNNEGTHRLVLGTIQETLKARFGEAPGEGSSPYPARGRTAVWTAEEVALLGALPDAEVARRTGRSLPAVGKKRLLLGRPAVTAEGTAYSEKFWKPEEDEAVRTLPPEEAARRTGRSVHAVHHRRATLGIAGRAP